MTLRQPQFKTPPLRQSPLTPQPRSYMCTAELINILVNSASPGLLLSAYGINDPRRAGGYLWGMNLKACLETYSKDRESITGGGYVYSFTIKRDPLGVIKGVIQYMSNSCRAPEWADSKVQKFCDALIREQATQVPGFDDATLAIQCPAQTSPRA